MSLARETATPLVYFCSPPAADTADQPTEESPAAKPPDEEPAAEEKPDEKDDDGSDWRTWSGRSINP